MSPVQMTQRNDQVVPSMSHHHSLLNQVVEGIPHKALYEPKTNNVPDSIQKPLKVRKGALKLVKTNNMPREEWLAVRQQGIGSSDAATAIGLNPYQSALELWMHKTGKAESLPSIDVNDDTHPVFWGNVLEPVVAKQYSFRTGRKVRKVNAVLQHPEYPWMLANIDREVIGCDEVQILECKTAGINGAKLWKNGVPEYVLIQVMHQLAVTGKQAADVAVLVGGNDLRIYRVERDEAMIEQLIHLEKQFWDCVQNNQAPSVDGSNSADMALRALYPQDNQLVLDLSNDADMNTVFNELQKVRDVLADYSTKEAILKQRIQERMQDNSFAQFRNGSISWKKSADSSSIDAKALAKNHPELANQYLKTRAGSRRFNVLA